MTILYKPQEITKGLTAEFQLNKENLIGIIPLDHYFRDPSNWYQVHLHYTSIEGNQHIPVTMDAQDLDNQGLLVGHFNASDKSLDDFTIEFINIYDFEGGKFTIERSALPIAEFDVDLNLPLIDNAFLSEDGTFLLSEDSSFLLL